MKSTPVKIEAESKTLRETIIALIDGPTKPNFGTMGLNTIVAYKTKVHAAKKAALSPSSTLEKLRESYASIRDYYAPR